jgi:hypothetical protein
VIIVTEGRKVIAGAPTLRDAKVIVEAMGVVFMETDNDYPNCADAFLTDGRVVAIQPVGFKL